MKSPQAELTELYPCCDYEMRVCAYNIVGDGYETEIIPCKTLEDGNHQDITPPLFMSSFGQSVFKENVVM